MNSRLIWTTIFEDCIKAESSPFTLFSLATTDRNSTPHCRSCVFRSWLFDEKSTGVMTFTTDKRMSKVQELDGNGKFEACFYFAKSNTQFRLSGDTQILLQSSLHPSLSKSSQLSRYSPDDWSIEHKRIWSLLSPRLKLSFSKPPPGSTMTDQYRETFKPINSNQQ